ncbi:MAG: hypothetical protein QNK29_05200 [Desulfobacterales bacterium]|nr:hypothetical protein [Desulfobacterales bacterium]
MRKAEMKLESTMQVANSLNAIVFILLGLFCFMNVGCVSVPEQSNNQSDTFIGCIEPRPEICTQEYVPVCGYLEDGSQKTYSNACSACSDKKIIRYKVSSCP